jgi:hypothetical protein
MKHKKEKAKERICIGQWPGGSHWYVESSEGRKFKAPYYTGEIAKFPDLESAMQCALKYVGKDRIFVNLPKKIKAEISSD